MRANLKFFRFGLLICLGMTCFTGLAAPAATNNAAESAGTNAEDLLRSYLQIQEQLHNLQQADEKSREEADAAAARNTQLLNQRLDQIETSLASQHWDELKDMQRANEETQHFSRLVLIASSDSTNGSVRIHQDVRVYAGLFDGSESGSLTLAARRRAYVHVARGRVHVNSIALESGDGLQLTDTPSIRLSDGQAAEVLVFDLPE